MGDRLTLETADERELWMGCYASALADHERDFGDAATDADQAVRAYRERCPEPAPVTRTRARRAHEGHTTRLAGILGVSESANTMDDLLDLLAGRAPTRGAPTVDVAALRAILADEEQAADPTKASGPRRAEAATRAHRLRAALGDTPTESPDSRVGRSFRDGELDGHDPADLSSGPSGTPDAPGLGWWVSEDLSRRILASVRAMATQPFGFRDMQEHHRLTAEALATSRELVVVMEGGRCTRGADGLNYLAAKSDAVMWESRAKKLAESISREIGPAADGVADEDLWELVQALAAAKGDT